MSKENIIITATSDINIIKSLITIFGENPAYYSRSSFLERLKSEKIVIFTLEVDKDLKAFCLCEITNEIVKMHHFKLKETHVEKYFFQLVSHVFNYGKKFQHKIFRCERDFDPEPELLEQFTKSDYSAHERILMTLQLKDFKEENFKLNENYTYNININQNLEEIASCIYESVKDTIDAQIYSEYGDIETIRNLFGFKNKDRHDYNEPASVLIFNNKKLVGINLVGLDGDKKAYISQLAINPNHRRKHLGKYAMIKSILALIEMEKELLYLHVTVGNQAQFLYESLGFKKVESRWIILKQY
jgi:ribosomal protein S18 acetylase RimI-like enzyme